MMIFTENASKFVKLIDDDFDGRQSRLWRLKSKVGQKNFEEFHFKRDTEFNNITLNSSKRKCPHISPSELKN